MNFYFFSSFIFVWLNLFLIEIENQELKRVIEIFRHGARQPIYEVVKVKATNSDSKMSMRDNLALFRSENMTLHGQLTSVGMRQHYLLGKTLQKIYGSEKKLINDKYDIRNFHVMSTDVNRTIQSAYSQLLGFFDLESGPDLPETYKSQLDQKLAQPPYKEPTNYTYNTIRSEDFTGEFENAAVPEQYQSIPIHVTQDIYQYLLTTYDSWTCEVNSVFQKYWNGTTTHKKIYDYFWPKCEEIFNQFEIPFEADPFENLYKCSNIWDVYQDYLYAGQLDKINETEKQVIEDNRKFFEDIYVVTLYDYWYGWQYSVWFGQTPLFEFITKSFSSTIHNIKSQDNYDQFMFGNETSSQYKWNMLSAHDTSVGLYLLALNLTSLDCVWKTRIEGKPNTENCEIEYPNFACNLLIELYYNDENENDDSSDENNYYVKIRYNGDYKNICNKDSTICSYVEFKNRLLYNNIPNFHQFCRYPNQPESVLKLMLKWNSNQILDNI